MINLDFADVQTVMKDKGIAHIGIGTGSGDEKCVDAVKQAISSPLLDTTIEGASHVIINISGAVALQEANEAVSYIQELTGEDTNIIFGVVDGGDDAGDTVQITVIATGLENDGMGAFTSMKQEKPAAPKTNFPTREGQIPTPRKIDPKRVIPTQTARPVTPAPTGNLNRQSADDSGIKIPEFLQRKR